MSRRPEGSASESTTDCIGPGGEWRIHDVSIDGISLLLNYRSSVLEQLQHESLDELIAGMNHKNAAFRQRVHE